jgi:hypothetical protein
VFVVCGALLSTQRPTNTRQELQAYANCPANEDSGTETGCGYYTLSLLVQSRIMKTLLRVCVLTALAHLSHSPTAGLHDWMISEVTHIPCSATKSRTLPVQQRSHTHCPFSNKVTHIACSATKLHKHCLFNNEVTHVTCSATKLHILLVHTRCLFSDEITFPVQQRSYTRYLFSNKVACSVTKLHMLPFQ